MKNKQWTTIALANEIERRNLKKLGATIKKYRKVSTCYVKLNFSGYYCPPVRFLIISTSNKPHQSHRPYGKARK